MLDLLCGAFLLGLGIIVHPCAAAPNIAAMTFISQRSQRMLLSLTMYILGHTLVYFLLGGVLIGLARQADILAQLQEGSHWGHDFLLLLLLIAGVWLVGSSFRQHHHHELRHNIMATPLGAFFSGAGIACLFCPEFAFVFFGVVMPFAIAAKTGAAIIAAFALGTCVPMVLFAWILKTGKQQLLSRFSLSRTLLNRLLGVLFIIAALIMYFF